jgi:hypothetical protein
MEWQSIARSKAAEISPVHGRANYLAATIANEVRRRDRHASQ